MIINACISFSYHISFVRACMRESIWKKREIHHSVFTSGLCTVYILRIECQMAQKPDQRQETFRTDGVCTATNFINACISFSYHMWFVRACMRESIWKKQIRYTTLCLQAACVRLHSENRIDLRKFGRTGAWVHGFQDVCKCVAVPEEMWINRSMSAWVPRCASMQRCFLNKSKQWVSLFDCEALDQDNNVNHLNSYVSQFRSLKDEWFRVAELFRSR